MLVLDQISKSYTAGPRQVPALQEVKLELEAGEFVAVHGPSGCGKTTMLLIAGGLLRPDSGHVSVHGQDLYELTPDHRANLRAQEIGMVFQEFHLVPYLSVLENILTPALVTRPQDEKALVDRAHGLIEEFGLNERKHHRPAALSTGERQRTALARALVHRPRLLLADEPTGNLDRENAGRVLGCMASFVEEGGAVLLVTHDDRCTSFSRTTVAMDAGRLIR